jgi:potassium-transporting ATPase KdpC subunit
VKTLFVSLRLLVLLTLLTGFLYPLTIWAVGRMCFPDRAEGSLITRDGHLVGSALLAQKTTAPKYFWPRPSAGDYATIPSGASNLAWTSAQLTTVVAERRAAYPDTVAPADLLTASASGLDPDLSPPAVRVQAGRVARARLLSREQRIALDELIAQQVVGGQFSESRINVLQLNLALDNRFPVP